MGGDSDIDVVGECVCPDVRCGSPGRGDSCLVASGQCKSVCHVHGGSESCRLLVRGSVPAWVAIASDHDCVWVLALPRFLDANSFCRRSCRGIRSSPGFAVVRNILKDEISSATASPI